MSGSLQRRVLDNGLTVVTESRGLGPVVFSGVVYRVGSRDERLGLTGISHLLEHMMFKGTEKFSKGDVAALVERNGGELNAFTAEDVTMYYEVFARDRWPLALEIESERMVNLKIDPAELDSEREVVLEERAMYQDIPSVELSDELTAATLKHSPYRWPIIGYEADIKATTREDLDAHYRRFYAPNNAALVVVGDVEPDEVFAEAEKYFGGLPAGPEIERAIPKEPPFVGETRLTLERAVNLPHLQMMFHAPEIGTKQAEALSLLAVVLSGTRTSRLDLALLETHRAGDVHVQYHAKQDPSAVTVVVEGESDVPIDEVESIVWYELERVAKEGVTADELERARNQTEAHHVISQQSPSNRGFNLGWNEAHGDVNYTDEVIHRLRALTTEDLQAVARAVFRRDSVGVATMLPGGGNGGGGRGAASPSVNYRPTTFSYPRVMLHGVDCPRKRFRSGLQASPAVERRVLANGMKMLTQRDGTDPYVAVSMLFRGGSFLDPPTQEGLSSVTADTLERGPWGSTFVEFTQKFERLGSHLSIASGAELIHVNVSLLKRHAKAGMELLADVLENPGFREEDFAVVKSLALNDLQAREDDLEDVVEDLWFRAVAGHHPYGNLPHGTLAGVKSLTLDDVRAFASEAFRPDLGHLALVGDFDEAELRPVLERLGALRLPDRDPHLTAEMRSDRVDVTQVATRDKAQAKIAWGGPGFSTADPDRLAGIVFNHVLGGSAIRSRLGDTIRDEQGLAYTVWSRNYERTRGGFFLVSMGTRPENVRQALSSIREQVTKLAEEGPTEAELQDAKDYLTGSFPLRFTTYGRLSRFWTRSSVYGWPDDYLQTYADRVRALTLDDVKRAGQRLAGAAGALAVAGAVKQDLTPANG